MDARLGAPANPLNAPPSLCPHGNSFGQPGPEHDLALAVLRQIGTIPVEERLKGCTVGVAGRCIEAASAVSSLHPPLLAIGINGIGGVAVSLSGAPQSRFRPAADSTNVWEL